MILAVALLPLLWSAPLAGGVERARVPSDVPMPGLLELTRQGEVMLLPRHNAQPFNAIVVTRAKEPCASISDGMMDVATWNKRWNIKDAEVLERIPATGPARSVKYELQLDISFAPRIPGLIQRPEAGKVIFNDVETGAQFIWTLDDIEGGCAMTYSLLETPGKASGWVAVVKALEETAVDAANFAAAVSSARGFAKPERPKSQTSAAADSAFMALASHGTALQIVRAPGTFPVVVARRVIDKPVDDVLWTLRDKRRWTDKVDVLSSVKDRGSNASYTVGAFGGRVSFDTQVVESGDSHTAEGLTLTETVTEGDIEDGHWEWRVRPVPGGTDVQLTWHVDIAKGSTVMRALARTDPVAKESMALHMALSLMGDVVGGRPIGTRALAKAP